MKSETDKSSSNLRLPFRGTGGKSLKAQHSILADAHEQIKIIEHGETGDFA